MELGPKILLDPRIPLPLHGMNPRSILGSKWWNNEKRVAKTRANKACECCNKTNLKHPLECHERYKIDYKRKTMTYVGTVAICKYCHNFIHIGRLQILVTKGVCNPRFLMAVQRLGENLIANARLRRPKEPRIPIDNTNWNKWRLVINCKRYRPKFKSYKEWTAYYENRSN